MTYSLESARKRLERDGYCIVENVLQPDTTAALREILDDVATAERSNETAWFSHGNQRIFMLLNKHDRFLELIDHPLALALVTRLLGEHALLSSITANITGPGNKPQQLHVDQGYIPPPWPRCEAVQLVWVIDAFTRANGATRLAPRSHSLEAPPPEEACISAEAPEGSIICMDGRLWHGTGLNMSGSEKRRGIFAYYCRPYLRQQENFSRSLERDAIARLTPRQRGLLGFDIWQGLGAVNGLPPSWMDGRERIGPTNADGLFDGIQ